LLSRARLPFFPKKEKPSNCDGIMPHHGGGGGGRSVRVKEWNIREEKKGSTGNEKFWAKISFKPHLLHTETAGSLAITPLLGPEQTRNASGC